MFGSKKKSEDPAVLHPSQNDDARVVVIPIDESKHAETAFEWYVQNMYRAKDSLRVVHCFEPPPPPASSYPAFRATNPEAWSEQIEKSKDRVHKLMDKYEQKMRDNKISGSVYSEMGRAGECVCRVADKNNANLIIMGSRGLGMVRRTVMGSCSEYVLHHTKVPVTIIPKDDPNKLY